MPGRFRRRRPVSLSIIQVYRPRKKMAIFPLSVFICCFYCSPVSPLTIKKSLLGKDAARSRLRICSVLRRGRSLYCLVSTNAVNPKSATDSFVVPRVIVIDDLIMMEPPTSIRDDESPQMLLSKRRKGGDGLHETSLDRG